jgi:predicted MPP superfamily phosphohydrolase
VVDFAQRVSKYGSKFNRGLVEGARHRVFVSKGVGRPNGLRFGALPDVACLELITS